MKSFKKGNHIFGVHINSIKCKNGHTKYQGLNPLDHVGVYAKSNNEYHLIEKKDNNKWHYYDKIDGTSKVNSKHTFELNKIIPLSQFFYDYDWIAHNGYNNFSKWVK